MTRLNRITAYLTSRRNLAGSALALVGAGLALADPVGLGGLALVIGFYLVGALAVPSTPAIRPSGYDPRKVQRALSYEINAVSGRVPPDVIVRIQRIERTIRSEILPRIACLPPGSQDLYLIQRTALDWLPTAVERYLNLPGDYVSSQAGSRGWTALQVVIDELDLLEAEMRRVAEVVHRADMDRLLAHRRFLDERFRRERASG
ncbi:MAG: hypothetical protein E6I99_09735 [Chloroflexi bacterium]|nr:MAG: hypothetical protein E6I99_09735 [Chloroflexota bacterium]TMD84426.1 MAG: hypothetical protein E6I74_02890 [Chloroflexota bacterium]